MKWDSEMPSLQKCSVISQEHILYCTKNTSKTNTMFAISKAEKLQHLLFHTSFTWGHIFKLYAFLQFPLDS